jgi:signal transduction histidine kinase
MREILSQESEIGPFHALDGSGMSNAPTAGAVTPGPEEIAGLDPTALVQAFETFTQAAGSLENSYALLQAEVARLRQELERKNRDLAGSLAENERMRLYQERILEGLPCGVLVVDPRFRWRYANASARHLLRLDGRAPFRAEPIVPSELRRLLEDAVLAGAGAERVWSQGEAEDSCTLGVTCAILPQDGVSRGDFVFILRDMTQQRRLEKEREFARRMQALAEMTALLAHEIRNPLGSMELFASLIKEATLDEPEVSQWVMHLQAGLRALSATVNNVLHFYSQAPPQTVSLDLVRLLSDTIQFLQPLALQRSLGIELAGPAREITVQADPHRLQQVFFNLAINGFRAMSAGGVMTVRVVVDDQADSTWAGIEFEDQGPGISAENLERIFEAGFTTHRGSPGLGLAVCKRLVEQHGGTLTVKSTLGRGTIFRVNLPRQRGAPESHR